METACSTNNQERLSYLDVAKGLGILLVVLHHIVNVCNRLGLNNTTLQLLDRQNVLYCCFFMQMFFMVSGYCTNFNKPFKSFLLSRTKTLLVPFLFFGVLMLLIDYLFFDLKSIYIIVGEEKYFYVFECSWFFTALFIAEIIQCAWVKMHINTLVQGCLWLLILLIVIYFNSVNSQYLRPFHHLNFFHYKNGLCMGLFVWLGYFVRQIKLSSVYIYIIGALYVLLLTAFCLLKVCTPILFTHETSMLTKDIPMFLLYSVSGSAFFILISRIINSNAVLEFFGRNSLIVYGVQFFVLKLCVKVTSSFWRIEEGCSTVLFYITIFIEALIVSTLFVHIINNTSLKVLIGKNK